MQEIDIFPRLFSARHSGNARCGWRRLREEDGVPLRATLRSCRKCCTIAYASYALNFFILRAAAAFFIADNEFDQRGVGDFSTKPGLWRGRFEN